MWGRLFGRSKEEPKTTLDDAAKSVEARGDKVDAKLQKMDAELLGYKKQMAKMKPGPARKQVEQKALRLLKQKKMYEKQRESLYNQSFNIDQTKFAQENVKETAVMVGAMKNANKELKAQVKDINLDDIEDLHDDMTDMLEMTDEIQDVMGRSYDTNQVDESELMDELNSLEDTIETESNSVESVTEEPPSYLVSAASAANKITAAAAGGGGDQKVQVPAAPAKAVVTVGGGAAPAPKPVTAAAAPAPAAATPVVAPGRKLLE